MSSESLGQTDAVHQQGRVPDFFIVGHHKSGTTAMYEMLRRHPQIYMPEMKEPEYFGRKHTGRREAAPGSAGHTPTFAETRPQTYAEYLSLFSAAAPDQRVGEASPSYLRSLTAARDIAAVQPAARIVAILREPVSFLYSLHLQMVRNHVQGELDFGNALLGEGVAGAGGRVHQYTDRIRYVEQLRRYHDVFGSEQILVLIYDDFRADNARRRRRASHPGARRQPHDRPALEASGCLDVRAEIGARARFARRQAGIQDAHTQADATQAGAHGPA
jgi:hypothetical protein